MLYSSSTRAFAAIRSSGEDTFDQYPDIGSLLPAMGYSGQQIKDLQATINATDCDGVVIATPIDLRRLVKIRKPSTRVRYDLQAIGRPNLEDVIDRWWARRKRSRT